MYFLIIIPIVMSVADGCIAKYFTGTEHGNRAIFLYSEGKSLIGALLFVPLALFMGGFAQIPASALLAGTAGGLIVSVNTFFAVKAMREGPMALSVLFLSSGFIIPCITGGIFFGETVTAYHILSVVLQLLALVLISNVDMNFNVKNKKKYLFYLILSMLGNGGFMVIQKVPSVYFPSLSGVHFLAILFLSASVISVIFLFVLKGKISVGESKQAITISSMSGSCLLIAMIVNLILGKQMPANTLFTLQSAGTIILNILTGILFYKDHMTIKKGIGALCSLSAILMVFFAQSI